MADETTLLPSPVEGERLDEYLHKLSDKEIEQIFDKSELLTQFCHILQTSFQSFERKEDCLEKLWKIIERLNNIDSLLYFIKRLEPARKELLNSLSRNEKELQRISTYCTIGRIAGSAVDVIGTLGGLVMKDKNPGYATLAFRTATAFGLLGFASAYSEQSILKSTLDDVMKLIKDDEEYFTPVHRWYHQTNELEEAMQEIFPFDVTHHVLSEFKDARKSETTPARLLAALIRSIAEEDVKRIRDEGLMRNLIDFSLYPASQDWVEWIIFRRHPVILDIARIILQLQSTPLRFSLTQSIPILAVGDQSIESFPVWIRIGLNLLSMTNSIGSLHRNEIFTIASELRHLYKHYESEMAALQRIAEFIKLRRRRT